MAAPKVTTVDYETFGIESRPDFPPEPVGVAIKKDRKKWYMAWGHPTKNNCTKRDAQRVLRDIMKEDEVLFHNAQFDLAVTGEKMGVKLPTWDRVHDTMFLAFLNNPRDDSLALKSMAEKYLGIPPDEQDLLHQWIEQNLAKQFGPFTKKSNPVGKYIAYAPGDLVGKYAIGDVERTHKMFELFWPVVIEQLGMMQPYKRELRCLPIFEAMSAGGIRVATKRLQKDLGKWQKEQEEINEWIRRRLKAGPDFNPGSGTQLAEAMDRLGKVDHWELTDKGNRSTARGNLLKFCNDKELSHNLARVGIINTYTSTFMEPWLQSALKHDHIFPEFHQVRATTEDGKAAGGTRTGRPSSSRPNLYNVPKNPEDPDKPWTKGLPVLRDYLIPDEGCVFLDRDYSQQELRILAHYEDGEFMLKYLANPDIDAHDTVKDLVKSFVGKEYPRKYIKETNFGLIYGMGLSALADRLGVPVDEAKDLKSAVLRAIPGVKTLMSELKKMSRAEDPLQTWGGRLYWTEEPKIINGKMRTFEYKDLNVLIQGSAADVTKEAMIRVDDACSPLGCRMVTQVYDQLLICAPKGKEKQCMIEMREAMESIELDVPLLSEGEIGRTSWGSLKPYDPRK